MYFRHLFGNMIYEKQLSRVIYAVLLYTTLALKGAKRK